MTISLGAKPLSIDVNLSRGADFVAIMRRASGDWDDDTTIELVIGETTWAADIDGDTATWNVDKAEVDTLITTKPSKVKTRYANGTADALWGTGRVSISG